MSNENKNTPFDLDRFNNQSAHLAGRAAVAMLDKMQSYTPEQQVAGAALVFTGLLRRYGIHAGLVLDVANNMFERAAHNTPGLKAVIGYTRNEV